MQRQSLGSPSSCSSKMMKDHGVLLQSPSASTPTALSGGCCFYGERQEDDEAEELKKMKPPQPQTPYIHIIPLLTLFCFLILYLSSHHPSPYDLAQFNGFKPSSSSDSEDSILQDIKKGDVLAIRSLKNSEQAAPVRHRLRHRKMVRV